MNISAKENWKNVNIIIIDEVSMLGGSLFDKLDYIAKHLRKSSKPFGGIQLILCGDMLQLPPINDTYIFESETFNSLKLKIFNLTKQRRYDNKDFYKMLLRIRLMKTTKEDIETLKECHNKYTKLDHLVSNFDIKPTILFSKKLDVDEYNYKELSKLSSKIYTYEAHDSFIPKDKSAIITNEQREYYRKMLNNNISEILHFKEGAQIMLKINIDVKAGLINGSRGIIVDINTKKDCISVKFIGGAVVDISSFQYKYEDKENLILRDQIPLILAWSLTIHKCQGSTLDSVICDLGNNIFTYSQAYVALSRVRNLNGLYISQFDEGSLISDPKVLQFIKCL